MVSIETRMSFSMRSTMYRGSSLYSLGSLTMPDALSIFTWLTIDHPFQRSSTVDGVALSSFGDSVIAYVPVLLHVSISK